MGGGGRASPDARPRDSRRTGRRPLREEAARTVAGHISGEELAELGD